jgi:NADPH2:quinone reductase
VAEAAAVPLTGSTALQLLDRLALGPGQSVLVHGASGGVGRMFVQLAHARGIRVAAAARQHRHALLHDLGIELVLDREHEDVMRSAVDRLGCPFDAIADLAGHGLLAASLPGLREGGSAGSIVELRGDLDDVIDRNVRLHGVLVHPDRATLDRLADAVEADALRLVVDDVIEPDSIVETHRALEAGDGLGKAVMRMTRSDTPRSGPG